MTGVMVIVALLLAACGSEGSVPAAPQTTATANARAPGVLLDVTGTGSATSQRFNAPSDWAIDYTYDCAPAPAGFGLFIVDILGDAAEHPVDETGKKGQGTSAVKSGGSVYLSIFTECAWHLTARAVG